MREDITSAAGLRKEEGSATSKCQGSLVLRVFRVYEDYTIFVETSHTPPPPTLSNVRKKICPVFKIQYAFLVFTSIHGARLSNTLLTLR